MKKITKYFCFFVVLFVVITGYRNYKYHNALQKADILFTENQSKLVNNWYDSYEQDKQISENNKKLNDNAGINYVKPAKDEKSADLNDLEIPKFTTGLQAYMFAEKILSLSNGLYIEVTGQVDTSLGVSQKVKNVRKVDNFGNMYGLSVTYSTFMKKGFETYYNTRQLKTRETSSVTTSLNASFNNNWNFSSLLSYKQTYGVLPNELNYIVNENTLIGEENFSFVNGIYSFELNLNPISSTENYKKNIKATGGASGYPIFKSVKLTVTIDEKARFKSIKYNEVYEITAMGITTMTYTNLTENFYTIHGKVSIDVPSGF